MKRATILTFVIAAAALTPRVFFAGGESADSRGIKVEEIRNDHPAFAVRVDVDNPQRTYAAGEEMRVSVQSAKKGYLYLLYESADKQLSCLFPNRVQSENRIPAGKPTVVPASNARFRLRVGRPFGREVLKAIVSLEPVPPEHWGVRSLTDQDVTPLKGTGLKGVFVQLAPELWAEHQVEITTVEKRAEPPKPRRVAVIVGLSRFQDSRIRPLTVGHLDAQHMAEAMRDACHFDEVILLTNDQATLQNIETAIRRRLVESTRPGDTVCLFWSGHGARCADDNGDERDGYDEYLVPHDGKLDDLNAIRRTMLLDDTFGRWLQDLDGRRIVCILDTCHSGGQSQFEKGLGLPDPAGDVPFDFLDNDLARTKDIGQKDTAMLASALANQVAFERREGDMSVMTFFLVKLLKEAKSPVTLTHAFDRLKTDVPAYVKERFPGTTQEPLLVDNTTSPVLLRP